MTRPSLRGVLVLFTVARLGILATAFGTRTWRKQCHRPTGSALFARGDKSLPSLKRIREQQVNAKVVSSLVFDDSTGSSGIQVRAVGQAQLPVAGTAKNQTQLVLVLAKEDAQESSIIGSLPVLMLPLASPSQLQLLSFATANRSLSKSVMLQLNSLLINRDGGLFDNLPWSQWSIDPQLRNRDAARNPILEKFHFGKRDAYNRFMGKDWQGRSLAIGNMALRIKYMLEGEKDEGLEDTIMKDESERELAMRILQLKIREIQMQVAETESDLAVARTAGDGDLDSLVNRLKGLRDDMGASQSQLQDLNKKTETPTSLLSSVMDGIARWSTGDGNNAAPYRGATGYAPMLDTKKDIQDSICPYTSPYGLLDEILDDQLNAKVIGCALENSSLLRGNIALGGAVVLQRKTPKKTMTLMGEKLEVDDMNEEFGNQGVTGGELLVVECDADEAVGLSLALDVPLQVEGNIFESTSVRASPTTQDKSTENSKNIWNTFSPWKPTETNLTLQVEGVRAQTADTTLSPVAIPRTTAGMIGIPLDGSAADKKSSLFPTDNPVRSLDALDSMDNADKAKTLLEMSNFQGKLPRPRVVRNSKQNPLDDLMLPLIDESVRREYRIRRAKAEGDTVLVEQLMKEKSRYQQAKERASSARQKNQDGTADAWESEAEFLESLRADITQDEGSYSRFLDKDEWYERDRLARASRTKRSSFGNLLDGIE